MTEASGTDPAAGRPDPVAVAVVRKPVGLQGWCAISVYGQTLERLRLPRKVLVGRDAGSAVPRMMTGLHRDVKGLRGRFDDCPDRDAAERLREQTIFILGDDLPPPDEGEFYHFELEGMAVEAEEDSRQLGVVVAVHNFPTTDAVEVRLREGGLVVVPLAGDTVRSIDRTRKRITVSAAQLEELL